MPYKALDRLRAMIEKEGIVFTRQAVTHDDHFVRPGGPVTIRPLKDAVGRAYHTRNVKLVVEGTGLDYLQGASYPYLYTSLSNNQLSGSLRELFARTPRGFKYVGKGFAVEETKFLAGL